MTGWYMCQRCKAILPSRAPHKCPVAPSALDYAAVRFDEQAYQRYRPAPRGTWR